MRIRRDHLGADFEVWAGGQSWFWCLLNQRRNGGAIGAAATEAEAIREAFVAIEEMSTQQREDERAVPLPACPFFTSVIACDTYRQIWPNVLAAAAAPLSEPV